MEWKFKGVIEVPDEELLNLIRKVIGKKPTVEEDVAPVSEAGLLEWTPKRLAIAKRVAEKSQERRPIPQFLMERTFAGEDFSAAEVRERFRVTVGQMNGQLAWFTKQVKEEIPEWRGRNDWHWPFSPYYRPDERYSMPDPIREMLRSL